MLWRVFYTKTEHVHANTSGQLRSEATRTTSWYLLIWFDTDSIFFLVGFMWVASYEFSADFQVLRALPIILVVSKRQTFCRSSSGHSILILFQSFAYILDCFPLRINYYKHDLYCLDAPNSSYFTF